VWRDKSDIVEMRWAERSDFLREYPLIVLGHHPFEVAKLRPRASKTGKARAHLKVGAQALEYSWRARLIQKVWVDLSPHVRAVRAIRIRADREPQDRLHAIGGAKMRTATSSETQS
jgi:hypothetical protein